MPNNYIKSLVKKGKGSAKKLEKKWKKAKNLAKKQGHAEEYDYITGIFNRMIGEMFGNDAKHIIGKMGMSPNMKSTNTKDNMGIGKIGMNRKKDLGMPKGLGLHKEEDNDIEEEPTNISFDILLPFNQPKDVDLVDSGEIFQNQDSSCECGGEEKSVPEKDLLTKGKYVFTMDDIDGYFNKGDIFDITKDIMPKKKINNINAYEIPISGGEKILITSLFFEPIENKEITLKEEDGGAGGNVGGIGGNSGASNDASISGVTTGDVSDYGAPMKMGSDEISRRTAPDNGTNFKRTWDKVKSKNIKIRRKMPAVDPTLANMLKSYKFN